SCTPRRDPIRRRPPRPGRFPGPLPRTVMGPALAMVPLSRPDPRGYMALPYQEGDCPALLNVDVKGKKLGLLLDAGVGITPQPAVRDAIAAAARAFEQAGAIVEPAPPFLTRDMLDGLDC